MKRKGLCCRDKERRQLHLGSADVNHYGPRHSVGVLESRFRLQRLGWPTPYEADSLDLTDTRLADEGWCAC